MSADKEGQAAILKDCTHFIGDKNEARTSKGTNQLTNLRSWDPDLWLQSLCSCHCLVPWDRETSAALPNPPCPAVGARAGSPALPWQASLSLGLGQAEEGGKLTRKWLVLGCSTEEQCQVA